MKKFLLYALMVLLLFVGVACNNNAPTTNQDKNEVQNSEETNKAGEEKPFFDMIGAVDVLKKAKEENSLIKDWVSNGKFLLETKNETAINVFNSVK